MNLKSKSIRPFIGSKNFEESKRFYIEIGFAETYIDPKMSVFRLNESVAFYLQGYYNKDWVENTMVFIEIEDVEGSFNAMTMLQLESKYKGVKFSSLKYEDWGIEFHVLDPAGNLLHFGCFNS